MASRLVILGEFLGAALLLTCACVGSDDVESGGSEEATPLVQIGTHAPGVTSPQELRPLAPGDTVPVVQGSQGLPMLVLGFCVDHLAVDRVRFHVTLAASGESQAELGYLQPKQLLMGSDGSRYYLGIFLVVVGFEDYPPGAMSLSLELRDSAGAFLGATTVPVELDLDPDGPT